MTISHITRFLLLPSVSNRKKRYKCGKSQPRSACKSTVESTVGFNDPKLGQSVTRENESDIKPKNGGCERMEEPDTVPGCSTRGGSALTAINNLGHDVLQTPSQLRLDEISSGSIPLLIDPLGHSAGFVNSFSLLRLFPLDGES